MLTHIGLIRQLVNREVRARYKGAFLGVLWAAVTPLLMLALYAFVFGGVMKSAWPIPAAAAREGVTADIGTSHFALIIFIGLVIFSFFSEVIGRAPGLVLENINYVKKIVFPLETLVPVAVGSAAANAAVGLLVFFAFMLYQIGFIPLGALWLPVIILPLLIMSAGLAWFLAALGVYVRDVRQIIAPVINGLMFLSPIFFPLSAMPEWIRGWVQLNPLTFPVEESRNVLFWNGSPDAYGLALYYAAAITAAVLGYLWFKATRRGFADVI